MRRCRPICALAILIALCGATTLRAAYKFTNIVDSNTTPVVLGYEIDGATVAVQTRNEIFTVTGGVRTTIAKVGDAAPVGAFGLNAFVSSPPSIGLSGGRVSFRANYDDGVAVFSGSGGPLTTIAKVGDVTPQGLLSGLSTITGTSVSNARTTFLGSTGASPNTVTRLFAQSAGTVTTIAARGDAVASDTLTTIGEAAISGDRVAFTALTSNGAGVFSGTGGPLTTIVKRGDPAPSGDFSELFTFDRPAIRGDRIAFRGVFGSNVGIFTGNGGPLTTIAKTGDAAPSGVFLDLGKGPRTDIGYDGVNVAFFGTYTGNRRGIFVGDGASLTTVLKSGDQLFGQTHSNVFPSTRVGLDPHGSGNVVFSYQLANGVTGIAMATPVPEPAALTLATTHLALIRRRRPAR
jgi:hypothetical protein